MTGIVIQNVPYSGKDGKPSRGMRTQWGGSYIHHHGYSSTIRQAAFDALAVLSWPSFIEHQRTICQMIQNLENVDDRGLFEVRISIPCNVGPRRYKDGTYHPGTPDVIDRRTVLV